MRGVLPAQHHSLGVPSIVWGVGNHEDYVLLHCETSTLREQVLIGVSIGVASDMGIVRSLLAAITFHQFFEGIALGACFLEVGTPTPARLCSKVSLICLPGPFDGAPLGACSAHLGPVAWRALLCQRVSCTGCQASVSAVLGARICSRWHDRILPQ